MNIMNNKSSIYGYYGGVRSENVYTPPPNTPFVPQPPRFRFKESYAQALEPLTDVSETTTVFLSAERPYLMRRYLESRIGDTESYKINTAAHPNDLLTYNTGLSGAENLLRMDGGTF